MTNSLTRIVAAPVLIRPGTPGTPGTPPHPASAAYTVTSTHTGWVYGSVSAPLPVGPTIPAGAVFLKAFLFIVDGVDILELLYKIKGLVTTTTYYPPVEASPGTPPIPGTPPVYSTAGTIGWNGGARSIEDMDDGAASFYAGEGIIGAAAGLRSSTIEDYRFASVDFGFYLSGGIARIIERGVYKSGPMAYATGVKFSVESVGDTVRYFYNGALIQASEAALVGRSYLNASLYTGGDSLLDAGFALVATASASASASFRPMASVADEGDPGTTSTNILSSLTSDATSDTPVTSVNTMLPLASLSGDVIYAEGRGILRPLESAGIDLAEPVPSVTMAAASLYPMMSSSIMDNPPAVLPPAFTFTVEDVSWSESEWVGFTLHIVSGTGSGQFSLIVGSLEQALLLEDNWTVLPDATSRFEIRLGSTVLLAGRSAAQPSTFLPIVSLAAETEYAGASGELLPMTSLALVTQAASITAILSRRRRPWLNIFGHDATGDNALSYTAKARELRFYTGHQARITARKRSLTASGTGTSVVGAILIAPKASLVSSGTTSGAASSVMRPMARVVISHGGVVAQVSRGRPTVAASGTSGGIASARLTTQRPRLVATVTAGGQVSALLVAPRAYLSSGIVARLTAPQARIVARVSAVAVVAYDAYSINLKHIDQNANDEVTSYTNFPFDRILRYGSSYYGIAADGLYLLDGTTDDSEDITYAVKTCIDDFGVPEKKTMVSAYFSGRVGQSMTVSLHAGEDGSETYSFSTPRGQAAQNHRQKFGRGVKNRYFALGITGSDVLELDTIDPEIIKLSRRI